MYIADASNNRVRKVTVSTGVITTVAGTGTASYSGDNSDATAAALTKPFGVGVDSSGRQPSVQLHRLFTSLTPLSLSLVGNFYICDYGNNRVRKVTVSNTYFPRYVMQ